MIGILVDAIHAFFYEMTFRGLLITLGTRSLHFWKTNLIQAGLYTFWFLIPLLRLVLYYSSEDLTIRIPTLFVVMLVYEILCAVKLGLLRFSTGAVWVCIFDHFAFACLLDMIHIQHTAADMTVQLDQHYYPRILCYQAISLLMAFGYYLYKKPKIEKMQKEAGVRRSAHRAERRSEHHTAHHAENHAEHRSDHHAAHRSENS